MKPSDKFKKVLRVTRLCAKICGADIADPNYKLNWITCLMFAGVAVYISFLIYSGTINIHEGWGHFLQSFCTIGTMVQGVTKLVSGIIWTKTIYSQTAFLTSIYVKYEAKNKDYVAVLNKCISRVRTVLKAVAWMYVIVCSGLVSVPVAIWLFTGRRLLPVLIYIPLVDLDTSFGYFSTLGLQIFFIFFGSFGNFAADMFMLVFFGHITVFVDIMRLKIKELNKMSKDIGNPMVMEMLFDLLKWHQTITTTIEITDESFFWINTMQVVMCGLSMVLTLFVIFTSDWPASYGYLLMLFVLLYMYCIMGTIAEVANDDIMAEIYDINFYNLTVSQQKIVGFMLMKAQSPTQITVGGVMPLSVSTGLQVTKTVYSILMMLINS